MRPSKFHEFFYVNEFPTEIERKSSHLSTKLNNSKFKYCYQMSNANQFNPGAKCLPLQNPRSSETQISP